MTDLSPETVGKLVALAARKGGSGPHMDKTDATLSQLAQWAEDAAKNISNGWQEVEHFSGCMGGWEQTFLRHVAKELRAIADVLPKAVDPDLEWATKQVGSLGYSDRVRPDKQTLTEIIVASVHRGRALAKEPRP